MGPEHDLLNELASLQAELEALKRVEAEHARIEEELRHSEERYRALYNNTPVMMHSIDHDGLLLSVNDHWLRVMGYERDEVIGRPAVEFLTEESRRYGLEVAIPRLREHGSARDIEYRMVKKGGEVIDVVLSATAEFDEQGRIIHSSAFLIDVTDRKRAEEELRRSEARFRQLVEHAEDAVFLVAPDGSFVDVNGRACQSLGYTRDELIGMRVPEVDIAVTEEQSARMLEEIVPNTPYTLEGIHRRKDGSTFPVEVRVGVFEADQGKLRVAIARDLTERKKAEEALRASEERFAGIFKSAMDAIVIVDSKRRINLFNEAAERIFRCPASEAVGKPLDRFLSPQFRLVFEDCLRAFREEGVAHRYLWAPEGITALRADGEEFSVEATISRFEIEGQELCTLILRDVEDRKRAEAELGRLKREMVYLQEELETVHGVGEMVGSGVSMKRVFEAIDKVAPTDSTVLITGETGTGKELVARAIHNASARRRSVFVKVDSSTLPAGLIESELFGHEKGAFTGAHARKSGRFELADGGTIFLDEVGELPLDLQVKLLRVLQDGTFERVGGTRTLSADVRVIAATNRDLEAAVREGRFRSDLFYRLNVFPIRVPALRERREDVPVLVRHFVMKYAARLGKRIEKIPQRGLDQLSSYDWPGNVRELENVIERAVILSSRSELELDEWLPRRPGDSAPAHLPSLAELEREHITRVLRLTGWRVRGERGAARILGLKPTTLEARMKRLGIERQK